MRETTALGAAIAAGLAVGLWRNFAELRDINRAGGTVFRPQMSIEQSRGQFRLWEKAVGMCRGWIGDKTKSHSRSPGDHNGDESSLKDQTTVDLSKSIAAGVAGIDTSSTTTKSGAMKIIPSVKMNGGGEMVLSKPGTPWINISGDLNDSDDQDLFLELRRVEILQRLKRLGKVKVAYL
jgi:glycerol kinase